MMSYKPKVGYVVKRYPRYSETFIVNELIAHERAGYEIVVFSLRPTNDTNFQDAISEVKAPVYYIPYEGVKINNLWDVIQELKKYSNNICQRLNELTHCNGIDVYQGLSIAKFIYELNIEHLHSHFANIATTVTRIASILSDIPYTFTAHAKDIYHDDVDRVALYRKIVDAEEVVTISDFNLSFIKKEYRISTNKISRIYNGIDLNKFQFKEPRDNKPAFVSVGRLVEKKGFKILIQACSILKETEYDFKCEIIGTGEMAQELNNLIKLHNLEEHVKLLGPLPQNKMLDHISHASLFIAPCIVGADGNRDGIPTVLLESMALGIPCISTDVTGIPEIVKHNVTGLIVRQNDPYQLATAIKALISDLELRRNLSINARRLVEDEFDIEKNSMKLREIFIKYGSKMSKAIGVSQ